MKIYTCSAISEYILWGIILFTLIYAPPLLPYTHLMLGIFLLGIILIRFNSRYFEVIRESGLKTWIKLMIITLIYVFILPIPMSALYDDIVDLPHYYHLFNRFAVLLFMEFTCGTYLLTNFKERNISFLSLIKLIIGIAMIQSMFACAAFVFPSVKEFFLNLMIHMGGTSTENEGVILNRTFGFASSMLDQFGLCTGLIGGISFFLGVNYETKYIFYSLFIMVASLLNARSGIVIYVIAISLTIFFSIFINHNLKMIIKSFIMVFLIPAIFMITVQVISIYNDNTAIWLSKGVDSVVEFLDTGSSDKDNMAIITSDSFWELPDDLRVIIGTGHSRYEAEGYNHTDCGIVNDIWFVGILGVFVIYGTVLFLWLKVYRRGKDSLMKFIAIFFSCSFCVFDIKAVVIGYQPGGAIFFFMLFSSVYYTWIHSNKVRLNNGK